MSSFKAGAGKRNLRQNSSIAAAAAVLEATSSSTRTEFSAAVCQICNVIDELAQRDRDEATDANDESSWRLEAIQIVTLMINSASRTMQMRATKTITALASQCGEQLKREVTEVPGMATKLVSLMKSGALEAIGAIAAVTTDNTRACDLMREADAISFLAAIISDKATAVDAKSAASETP